MRPFDLRQCMRYGLGVVATLSLLAGCASEDEPSGAADAGVADATTDTGGTDGGVDGGAGDTGGADTGPATDTGPVTDSGPTDTGPGADVTDAGGGGTDAQVDTVPSDAADVAADAGPGVLCGTGSAAALAACVDQQKYVADLEAIEGHRPTESSHWQVVQDLCATRLEELGFQVERQAYGNGVNVIGTLLGKTQPDSTVLVGAHYDGQPGCPGADDNATGVAGALEVARVLSLAEHDRTLVVACWDEEERGTYGSSAWANQAGAEGRRIVMVFNYEMIGYFSSEPNTQTFPPGFGALFPEAEQTMIANDWRGDFIGLIADDSAQKHIDAMVKHAAVAGIHAEPVILKGGLKESALLSQLRRSDHRAFWDQDYPAVMITDTADFRNKNYHCQGGPDAVSTLDHASTARVIAGTVGAAAEALVAGDPTEGGAGRPSVCDPVAQDCAGGKKCAVTVNPVNVWVNACVDQPKEPVGKGEVCVRPTNKVGIDTCAPGLFCTWWGVAMAEPPIRRCFSTCQGSADCTGDEACIRPPASAHSGLCLPTCDPFDSGCGEGLTCAHRFLAYDDATTVYACEQAGAVGEGGACEPDLSECGVGLACALHKEEGTWSCRTWCDAAHPCAGAQDCVPIINPGAKPGIGFCWPK
ncbi:MAG: hypothetical protein AMXMBFR64_11370 [Myxococcales bacterium]